MMTPDKQGVFCDLCGREYKRKFSYYSAEFTKISADAEKKVTGPTEVDKKYLNLDVCEICYSSLTQKVVEIAKAKGLA